MFNLSRLWNITLFTLALLISTTSISYASEDHIFFEAYYRAKTTVDVSLKRKLQTSIQVRSVSRDEIVKFGGSEVAAHAYAFFDRSRRTIVVDPNRCRSSLFATLRTKQEISNAIFCLMLHELIHVYQDDEIKNHSPKIQNKWLRFICEGHAVYFSSRIALQAGVSDNYVNGQSWINSAEGIKDIDNPVQRRSALSHWFLYKISARYIQTKCKEVQDFSTLLKHPLSYEAVLDAISSQDYSNRGDIKRLSVPQDNRTEDLHAIVLKLQSMGECPHTSPPVDIDYLDAMAYLCPAQFPRVEIASQFDNGLIFEVPTGQKTDAEVMLMDFHEVQAAKAVFEMAAKYLEYRAGVNRTQDLSRTTLKSHDALHFLRDYPTLGRAILLGQHDHKVVAVNFEYNPNKLEVFLSLAGKLLN